MGMEAFLSSYVIKINHFISMIKGIRTDGMPEPHIPCVGKEYHNSPFKLAFYGMETYGWGDLSSFVRNSKRNIREAIYRGTTNIDDLTYLGWTNNFHTSFWDFVLMFLARLYGIRTVAHLVDSEKYNRILRSFVWGNTNSIERFHVTAETQGVPLKTWEKIKNASSIFDSPETVIQSLRPTLIVVLNWSQSEEWLSQLPHVEGPDMLNERLYYYFISNTGTHVLWMPHPRWIAISGGFKKWIEDAFTGISAKGVFDNVPERAIEEFKATPVSPEQPPDLVDSSKQEYLFHLSQFLNMHNTKMSGSELAAHFRRNGITTDYGTLYVGGRGVYKFISSSYRLYSENGEKEKADSIARAFVKQDGTYAYK